VALGIRITKVTPLYPRRIFLQWDLIDPTESGSYTFSIKRSGSINGPWEVLVAGEQNNYNYIDDFLDQPHLPDDGKAHAHSLARNIYYVVTVIPPSGCANSAISDPHGFEPALDPIPTGLRRRLQYDETVLFKRHNGVRLVLLKRRWWGHRCPDCYDPVTQATTKEQCLTCYGTSFIGGYWSPVVVWGRVNTPKKVEAEFIGSPRNMKEASPHVITLLDVPLLQDKDLLIETSTNNRYTVRRQTQTELRRHSVHQQVTASLMEHGSVEYRIPVDLRATPPLL
jgi:hypothetical protein